jgi:hypothetical protein
MRRVYDDEWALIWAIKKCQRLANAEHGSQCPKELPHFQ